ncbi:hypothetical protein, partial [Bacillus cereus group sp. Bce006]
LATLKNDTRDGQLVVVSRDLQRCVVVDHLASTLQQALDNWQKVEGPLQEISQALNAGQLTHTLPFVEDNCASPLPRAFQWADGSAYVNH